MPKRLVQPRLHRVCVAVVCLICGTTTVASEDASLGMRQRQWPPKTQRILLTDAQIARARTLCDTDDDAKKICDAIVAKAKPWVARPVEQLRTMLPDGRVPRAFNVSTRGCPVHGKAIYRHGIYPWKLNPDRPFTITCPIGGETYPSNDFGAYYASGFTDESTLTGEHVDTGRGWVSPSGEKYWLVGYATHWNWQNTWLPAVDVLSQAYVLTGERAYAQAAIAMLDRIAEIYPGMDYSKQSRYAELTNGAYRGKIVNLIWETGVFRHLAVAYDYVFDALAGDDALSLPWRTADQIRANIEANLIEEGIDAVARGDIRGNFGMHQDTLAHAVVVRQSGPTRELLESIFRQTGATAAEEGLDYALHNLVFKDGMPFESSPGYCFGWVSHMVGLAHALDRGGINLYQNAKMRYLFDAPLQMICASHFTPAIGDAGNINARWIGPSAGIYEAAFRHLRSPHYAWAVARTGGLKGKAIRSFDDLFEESIDDTIRTEADAYRHLPPSRVLDGYGLSVLNNAKDSIAVSMYQGLRGGHGHYDRLNIELFGFGHRLSPDLGYPDFMNDFVSGIYSWTKNTVSHNCLVVDRQSQPGNAAGRVLRFHDSPTIDVVDVDAAGTYPQADVYRRTLVLVEMDADHAYLVDVFRVRGGKDHVLSLHGPEGEFELIGAELPPAVTEGTLAGADVACGALYDDPVRGKSGYTGGFSGYRGSGYSHFFNWQHVSSTTPLIGHWRCLKSEVGLRMHIAGHAEQELTIADAYVSPTQRVPTILKYVLAQRPGTEAGNMFITVWEPVDGKPRIDRVEIHADAALGNGHERIAALSVHHGESTDIIAVAPEAGRGYHAGTLTSDAAVALVRMSQGKVTQTFAAGGSKLTRDEYTATVPATITGTIRTADYATRSVTIETPTELVAPKSLSGKTIRIFNDAHSCVYRIAAAERISGNLRLTLTGSDVFTGRVRIGAVDAEAKSVTTPTRVLYPHNVAGMRLLTNDLAHAAKIVAMSGKTIQLQPDTPPGPLADGFGKQVGQDAWIADFGTGDQIEIERTTVSE
ncbi:MAG: heparinase II/III family protein [Phycisphaerae bacterium]|nr:heparinase II/III family protein [Phycisphaerae bacterium]